MTKTADVRINETIEQIVAAFPRNGHRLKEAIQFQLMRRFFNGPERIRLGESIAIGGFHINDGARRSLERIYLLAQATVGGKNLADVRQEKRRADRLNQASLRELIQAIANSVSTVHIPGEVQFAESFGYAGPESRDKVVQAVRKAKRVLMQMHQGIRAVRGNPVERRRYERWFGRLETQRYEKVRSTIETICTDVISRPLKIYYRGAGVTGKLNDKPGVSYHDEHVKLQEARGEYGCFIPGWPGGGVETDRTHILLGGSFFTKCRVKSDPTDVRLISGAGVIIHELTHALCGCDDEKYDGDTLYGPRKCLAAAIAAPALAINNADSYRLFSDEYDTDPS